MSMDIIKTKVGEIAITAINDFTEMPMVRGEGGFFPNISDEELKRYTELYPQYFDENTIRAWTYYVYIIQDTDKTVLIDTGVGNPEVTGVHGSSQWKGRLLDRMKEAGISPEEIDLVFNTHIHADHIGWNAIMENGTVKKTFPNAEYIASQDDYNAFISGVTAGAIPEETFTVNISLLVESGAMKLVKSSDFKLSDHTFAFHTPGHIPGLMYAAVTDGDEVCILASDNFASPIQVTNPDCEFLYDVDMAAAKARKKEILQKHTGSRVLLGACHFGLGKVEIRGTERVWTPLKY